MEQYKLYLKKFNLAIIILIVSLIIVGLLIAKIVPECQKIKDIQDNYTKSSSELVEVQRRLDDLKGKVEEEKKEDANVIKAFFRPINEGLDTEAAIADEFSEILQLIRENKIKTRSIKYDPDPADDNFVKNVPNRYHVCRITADMVARYSDFENFLRDLYKHEHFIEISKIEIVPYQKNKRILLANIQFKLYAQRNGVYVNENAPASTDQPEQQSPVSPDATPAN